MTIQKSLAEWEKVFEAKIRGLGEDDPAHDYAHFLRVVTSAKRLAVSEGASLEVVLPAAWLHDLVNVSKDDPRRSVASKLSGDAALIFLSEVGYPSTHFEAIRHAIEAHSFSAKIETKTKEAAVVQDADRLDGLGAIGIARVFTVGGLLQRRLYEPGDPFGSTGRQLDDLEFTLDHFFVKLFKTAETLRTAAGREEGKRRVQTMKNYLHDLGRELGKEWKG